MKITDVKVRVLNLDKLINESGYKIPDCQLLLPNVALYENLFLIDTDACFSLIEKYIVNQDGGFYFTQAIELNCRIEKIGSTDSNGVTKSSISSKDDFNWILLIEDIEEFLIEKPLVDFIRYNYNPRIISNQNLLMEYINKSKKINPLIVK
jgi:hypothetical protein